MIRLSTHFTLDEMTRSQTAARHAISNEPGDLVRANLIILCVEYMEPIRSSLGKPITVTSGYRSTELNKKVGGSETSSHIDGLAVDFVVPGMSVPDAFAAVKGFLSIQNRAFDQFILEYGRWLHLGIGRKMRRQVLEFK